MSGVEIEVLNRYPAESGSGVWRAKVTRPNAPDICEYLAYTHELYEAEQRGAKIVFKKAEDACTFHHAVGNYVLHGAKFDPWLDKEELDKELEGIFRPHRVMGIDIDAVSKPRGPLPEKAKMECSCMTCKRPNDTDAKNCWWCGAPVAKLWDEGCLEVYKK